MNTARKFTKGQIGPRQIKAIHTAISKLGMDDDAYRDILKKRFSVESCKALTWHQAEELLDTLNGKTTPSLVRRGPGGGLKYADLDHRPGFATGAQCRLIAAMWTQVSRAENEEAREKALDGFCRRILNVAGLRMVKGWQVEKFVKALEGMGAVKKESKEL